MSQGWPYGIYDKFAIDLIALADALVVATFAGDDKFLRCDSCGDFADAGVMGYWACNGCIETRGMQRGVGSMRARFAPPGIRKLYADALARLGGT